MSRLTKKKGIVCKQCGNDALAVIYTRKRDEKIVRLRGCPQCRCRFLTLERVIAYIDPPESKGKKTLGLPALK